MTESGFCSRNDQKLAYHVRGSGAPVLLLSGFASAGEILQGLVGLLQNSFQTVIPDYRGMGESGPTPDDYELADLVDDAVAVMDHLEIREFHVVGVSMGGFVAQLLALKIPQRVSSLSLLCTLSGGEEYVLPPELKPEVLRLAYENRTPELVATGLKNLVHAEFLQKQPQRFQQLVQSRLAHRPQASEVLRQKRAADRFLRRPLDLSRLRMPTLVLSGADDRFVERKNSEILARRIKGAELKFYDGSDHFFFYEKENDVAGDLGRFLGGRQ